MTITLAFDTETTGLIQRGVRLDSPDQPHLVQLGMAQLNEDLEIVQQVSLIIKPDGYTIPKQASDVHGITTEKAEKFGIPLRTALSTFNQLCLTSDVLVGHNIQFDLKVMRSQLMRNDLPDRTQNMPFFCTLEETRNIIKIPPTERMLEVGITDYKSPNLGEAYMHFTGKELVDAHDALVDVLATIEIYKQLKPA